MRILSVIILILFLSGCEQEVINFTEVKRIDERITTDELEQFLAITATLPDGKPPLLPALFTSLPKWDSARTLAIQALVHEERNKQERLWDEKRIAQQLKSERHLQRILERHRITLEQYISLAHVIRISIVKINIEKDEELKRIWKTGIDRISKLESDTRTYSTLSDEEQFLIEQQAGWINRMDRSEQLLQVPPENVVLVKRHAEQLKNIFPDDFLNRPLVEIQDRLEVYGLPFEENELAGRDTQLHWTAKSGNAKIGRAFIDHTIVKNAPSE